jgi:hypothetical protein
MCRTILADRVSQKFPSNSTDRDIDQSLGKTGRSSHPALRKHVTQERGTQRGPGIAEWRIIKTRRRGDKEIVGCQPSGFVVNIGVKDRYG